MEFDIFFIILIILCAIGFGRFIQLIYVLKKGFKTKLEYASYSHASEVYDNKYMGDTYYSDGKTTIYMVNAKYRTENGLYLYKNVPQSVFGINSLEPVDIILFPKNEKKFIFKNKIPQWIIPIICTIILVIIVILFVKYLVG